MRGNAAWLRGGMHQLNVTEAQRPHRPAPAPGAHGRARTVHTRRRLPLPSPTEQLPRCPPGRKTEVLREEAVAWSGPKEGGDRDATACTSADLVFHHQTPNLLFLRCFLKCDPNRLRQADLGACGKARPGAVPGPRSRHFRADSGLGAVARPPTLEASNRASGITARHVLTFRFDTKGCSHLFSSLYVLSKFYVFTV